MGYAKEPGGWGEKIQDQPAGTPDRTAKPDEAFPRDVDEGMGRHARRDMDKPDRRQPARH